MTAPRLHIGTIVMIALAALNASLSAAQISETGLETGLHYPDGVAGMIPPGLDDAYEPDPGPIAPGVRHADVRDAVDEPLTGREITLWEQLAEMSPQQRGNAVIELELGRNAPATDQEAAADVAVLWRCGMYESALTQLRMLEEIGAPLGLGIAWKNPVEMGRGGLDRRIGGTRIEAQTMSLDFDEESGALFIVAHWYAAEGPDYWTVNISTNGGETWAETYAWWGLPEIIDLDGVVVGDYLYVAYVIGGSDANTGRIRRCFVSDGASDDDYYVQTVFDAGENTIEEVEVESNATYLDNRIYYIAIQNNDVLRYFYADAATATVFVDGGSPAAANAEYGLDSSWRYGYTPGSCDEFLYVSYTGNDDSIHVLGRRASGWTDWAVENGTGGARTTAISSYEETIICAFEYPYNDGPGIRYRISYNCGDNWSYGSIAAPDGTTVFAYYEPDVDARDGDGLAIIYQAEAGHFDPMYYRTREGFGPGAWSNPTIFNDYDVHAATDTAISHLPALADETFSHGACYISSDPDFRVVYFDRPGSGSTPCDDTTPPIIEIDEPTTLSCACDAVDIVGSVGDPDGAYIGDRLEFRASDAAAWTVADSRLGERSGVLYTWDASMLAQDYYYIRVVGENECNMSASETVFVYKNAGFDNLEMQAPADSYVFSSFVCFDGTAWTQSCFDYYTVDYRPAGVGDFTPVDPPNSPYTNTVINDRLATWYTLAGPTAVADGQYDVRLRGVTDCGDYEDVVHMITIDNTNPVALITSPQTCEYVTGIVDVYGTADDENLHKWKLQYAGAEIDGWETITPSTYTPVVNGLLGSWDTGGLPQCAYILRLKVEDEANYNCSGDGREASYYLSVNVGCRTDINRDGGIDLSDLAWLLGRYGETCE